MNDEVKKIYDHAVRFHGHPGVFLAIGIRMGLLALKYLNSKGFFELDAFIQTRERSPYRCLLDGIQFSTGCTIGKGNLSVKYSDGDIVGVFTTQSGKTFEITVRSEFLEQIKKQMKDLNKFNMQNIAEQVLKMNENAIFNFKIRENRL